MIRSRFLRCDGFRLNARDPRWAGLHALDLECSRPESGPAKVDEAGNERREAVAEAWRARPPPMAVQLEAYEGGPVQAGGDTAAIRVALVRMEGARAVPVDAIEAAKAAKAGR